MPKIRSKSNKLGSLLRQARDEYIRKLEQADKFTMEDIMDLAKRIYKKPISRATFYRIINKCE